MTVPCLDQVTVLGVCPSELVDIAAADFRIKAGTTPVVTTGLVNSMSQMWLEWWLCRAGRLGTKGVRE